MIKVNSTVKLNDLVIDKLIGAQTVALTQTAGHVHTEVVQAQVVPRKTGNLQNESMFVDVSEAKNGKVSLVHTARYARRLYFHPEYNFNRDSWTERVYGKRGQYTKSGREYKGKIKRHEGNANAKGKWFEDWVMPPDGNGKYYEQIKKHYAEIYRRLAGL